VKRDILVDIAAGTSIGAVNAAIIAGSRSDHPERDLDFWLENAFTPSGPIKTLFALRAYPGTWCHTKIPQYKIFETTKLS
jgi:predicted acylesterase/phospholipase RssA